MPVPSPYMGGAVRRLCSVLQRAWAWVRADTVRRVPTICRNFLTLNASQSLREFFLLFCRVTAHAGDS